ncbi:P-loop containing nucleoside triphosphate hydrolase protein [Obelidium mucronatum]|nr:P-loop containing nucleoside triphosphate hydrolase protein [Obelidium mucronatum]
MAESDVDEHESNHKAGAEQALDGGAGKSLPFQVAAIAQPNTAIVVTPLLALMDDQVSQCLSKNIAAAALHCEMSEENRDKVIKQVRSKAIKLLYVSPERMARKEFREMMKLVGVSLLVIDEAHCCIEWGEGFRPIYSMLPVFATELSPKAILCTTATANPHVSAKLCSQFGIDADCIFKTSIFRQNLYLDCIKTTSSNKRHVLLEQLHKYTSPQSPFNGTGIIYCQRRTDVDNLTKFLKSRGYCAREYHSQIPADKKREVLEWIMEGEVRNRLCGKGDCIPNKLVVATIAFGLGINAAISFVIHYTIPQSPERYLQEVGRAARKEEIKLGSCTTILTDNDYAYTSHLIGEENGYSLSVEGNKALVDSLLSQKSAPPQRLLVQLFREGIIEFTNYQPELWEYKVCRKLDNGELYLFCRKVVEELKEVSLRTKQGLEQMQKLFTTPQCFWKLFATLFDSPLDADCGKCYYCKKEGPILTLKKVFDVKISNQTVFESIEFMDDIIQFLERSECFLNAEVCKNGVRCLFGEEYKETEGIKRELKRSSNCFSFFGCLKGKQIGNVVLGRVFAWEAILKLKGMWKGKPVVKKRKLTENLAQLYNNK